MNRVLCWKELREQRVVWATVAVLAALLILTPAMLFMPGGLLFLAPDVELVRVMSVASALVLAVTYGLVCGAMMFAGEREAGTQVFLDVHAGSRAPVWAVKSVVGLVLAAAQAGLLFGLDLLTGVDRPGFTGAELFVFVLMLGLTGYAAGLFASALCRTALTAVGVGLALWFVSWFLVVPVVALTHVEPPIPLLVLGAVAVVASHRVYCRPDRLRRRVDEAVEEPAAHGVPSWRVLLWLAGRQGWVLLAVLAPVCVVFGLVLPSNLVGLWPPVGLAIGILCGLMTFTDEQTGFAYRLLGSQRVPPGRFWTAKVLSWLLLAAVLVWLVWLGVGIQGAFAEMRRTTHLHGGESRLWDTILSPAVFLVLWPLYGFTVGQLCSQLCRKALIAVPLALIVSGVLVALWVPSLVEGGLALWQILGVPLLLLLTTRLTLWAWFGDRLYTRGPLLAVAGCGVLALAWLAGMFWFRVAEVPDVGEPFDVPAFLASLPPPEQNEAGSLIKRAVEGQGRDGAVVSESTWLASVLSDGWDEAAERGFGPGGGAPGPAQPGRAGKAAPANPAPGRWLDQVFQKPWVKDYQGAARLPLGMVADPRAGLSSSEQGLAQALAVPAYLFAARALQLQAGGDDEAALEYLLTLLALSRQFRHLAPGPRQLGSGVFAESAALAAFDHWLRKVGPREKLLRRALEGLSRHEAEVPSPVGEVKAGYVALRSGMGSIKHYGESLSPLQRQLHRYADQVPWEWERSLRLLNAVGAADLRVAELLERGKPLPPTFLEAPVRHEDEIIGHMAGMNYLEGAGADLGPAGWGRLLRNSFSFDGPLALRYRAVQLITTVESSRAQVRGTLLATALALYQAEHRKLPQALQELVPRYLPALPPDPYNGEPFHYQISEGGEIPADQLMGHFREAPMKVLVGQGVLWCVSPQGPRMFVVPRWTAP